MSTAKKRLQKQLGIGQTSDFVRLVRLQRRYMRFCAILELDSYGYIDEETLEHITRYFQWSGAGHNETHS